MKMPNIILLTVDEVYTSDDYRNIEVVTSFGPWQQVTKEECDMLKVYCRMHANLGIRIAEQIDYASIIVEASNFAAKEREREAKLKKERAKYEIQREAASLRRKKKKLEALKKELGETLPNHGKYTEPDSSQQP